MTELFRNPLFTAASWFAAIFALLALAIAVMRRFRGGAAKRDLSASELLSNFQEMRKCGDISEADYRKIKSVLGEQLHGDVKTGKDKA